MRTRTRVAATTATVAALVALAAGTAFADGSSETTVLKNAAKPTYLANATFTGYGTPIPSWIDTATSGELVTYPAPGETAALVVGSTCIPRDQSPRNGGLIGSQPAGDQSTCMRFAAEQTSSGTFTFRVDEPGMPADGHYLGDGDRGGFLDLLSTTPLTQFIITPHPLITVEASASPAPASLAVGTDVQFRFVVTNTGNVDLTGLTLTTLAFDGSGTPGAFDCDGATLAPGAQTTCTSDYALSLSDAHLTEIRMTAAASATDPEAATVSSEGNAVLTVREPAPQLAATGAPVATAGTAATVTMAAMLIAGSLALGSAARGRRRSGHI